MFDETETMIFLLFYTKKNCVNNIYSRVNNQMIEFFCS